MFVPVRFPPLSPRNLAEPPIHDISWSARDFIKRVPDIKHYLLFPLSFFVPLSALCSLREEFFSFLPPPSSLTFSLSLFSSSFQVKFRALFLLLNRYIYTHTSVIQLPIRPTDTNFSPLIPYFLVGTTKRSTIVEINYSSRYFTRMIYLAVLLARIGNSLLLLSSIVECTWTVLSIQRFSILNRFASRISLSNLTDFPNSRTNVGIIFSSPLPSPFHLILLFRTFVD